MRDYFAKIGLIEPEKSASGKLLTEHIEDFGQSLIEKGDTKKQTDEAVSKVKRIAKECKLNFWTDIKPGRVQKCIAGLKNSKNNEPLSKARRNHYLKAPSLDYYSINSLNVSLECFTGCTATI